MSNPMDFLKRCCYHPSGRLYIQPPHALILLRRQPIIHRELRLPKDPLRQHRLLQAPHHGIQLQPREAARLGLPRVGGVNVHHRAGGARVSGVWRRDSSQRFRSDI